MKTEDSNVFKINVNISEIILTPLACASLVNEILKGILYQKCQIPYPYNWMKTIVTKKRSKTEENTENNKNIKAANHFRLVSNVFDKLEKIMQEINNEFSQHKTKIKEVVFVLGTTPYTPNEVFTINFDSLVEGHYEKNHTTQLNKFQMKILRKIFLSQDWLDKIDASLSCTNIYFYIVKTGNIVETINNVFVPTVPLTFSTKTKHMEISLNSNTSLDTNCECFEVFEENSDIKILKNTEENEDLLINNSNNEDTLNNTSNIKENEDYISWYKYKDLVKGFKDCFINKKSVIESW